MICIYITGSKPVQAVWRESGALNIVQSSTRNISLVCCLRHSYLCCALITHYSNKLMV